ncbi:uncharacterized protein BDV17DRAFT_251085 [Aspergillus undulatus]|uniref:uncharacterized protein n=1 Tax=Aspergillus undulatus TaxID=1810928 RepID=UPI003CCDA764
MMSEFKKDTQSIDQLGAMICWCSGSSANDSAPGEVTLAADQPESGGSIAHRDVHHFISLLQNWHFAGLLSTDSVRADYLPRILSSSPALRYTLVSGWWLRLATALLHLRCDSGSDSGQRNLVCPPPIKHENAVCLCPSQRYSGERMPTIIIIWFRGLRDHDGCPQFCSVARSWSFAIGQMESLPKHLGAQKGAGLIALARVYTLWDRRSSIAVENSCS